MLINNYFFDIFRRLLKNIHTYHKKYTSFQRKSTLLRTPSIMPSLPESALIFSAAALITTLMTAVPRSLERYAQPAHDIFPVFVEKFVHPVRFIEIFHDDGYYADLFFHAKLLPRIRRATPFTKSIITYNFV